MESNPKVSILIPNYNKAPYLRETLDSVLAQTYTNWECIIVDDHSTDNSWQILEEYALMDFRFKIFIRPENRRKGGNSARNFAFELSEGEYINWLDSDDLISSNFISEKISEFKKDRNFDFVICNIHSFEIDLLSSQPIKGLNLLAKEINFPLESLKGSFWIQTSLPLFKKSFLNQFEYLYHEEIIVGQESEFFVRVLLRNPNYTINEKAIIYWRKIENTKTGQCKNKSVGEQLKCKFLTHKKLYQSFEKFNALDSSVKEYFSKIFQSGVNYIPLNSKQFYEVLIFGIQKKLFKKKIIIIKIVFFRFLQHFLIFKD